MSNGAPVSFRYAYPTVLERGRAQAVRIEAWRSGVIVPITEAGSSLTIYDASNTAVLEDEPVTVTDGVASVQVTPATDWTLGEGYREEWTLVLPTETRHIRRECAVALRALYPVLADGDLTAEYPTILQHTKSTVTLQDHIDESWKEIIDRLIGLGHLPYLIMSPSAFRRFHKHDALARRFRHLATLQSSEDFLESSQHHEDKAIAAWGEISFKVDEAHKGAAGTAGRKSAARAMHRNVPPRRRMRMDPRW